MSRIRQPGPPTKLKVCVQPDDNRITVTWAAPTSGGPATGFHFKTIPPDRAKDVGASFILTLGPPDITPGTTYQICVRSYNRAGTSAWVCATVVAPNPKAPEAPVLTLIEDIPNCVLIVRTRRGGPTFIRKIFIYRDKLDGAGEKLWVTIPKVDTPHNCKVTFDSIVPPDQKDPEPLCKVFFYRAVAANAKGTASSAPQAGGIFPPTPAPVLTGRPGPCKVLLSWTLGSAPCGLKVKKFIVYRTYPGTTVADVLLGEVSADGRTFEDVDPGIGAHSYYVKAIFGSDLRCNKESNVVTVTPGECVGHGEPGGGGPS